MKNLRLKTKYLNWLVTLLCVAFGIIGVNAQSTNVNYPTAVTTNEINGKIAARDIGDSRLTTHYYVFNGKQGDIFVKILTSNFDGDIDIFVADTLRPITKISVYSDNSAETGREIYLRKSEKLILRVEGRTPGDAPATYSIKFDGSFLAVAAPKKGTEEPKLPEVKAQPESAIKVSSVGTIIKAPPKKIAPLKTTAAKTSAKIPAGTTTVPKPVSTVEEKVDKKELVLTEGLSDSGETTTAESQPTTSEKANSSKKKNATTKKTDSATKANPKPVVKTPKVIAAEELKAILEKMNLVILFKDGAKIERPLSEVLRFSVDKGILTVISKNGTIGRYSILEIVKTTIE